VIRQKTTVLVIGGGPAGSTAATLLVQQGYDVTLLERDFFPRYHIGESLLPSCRPILKLSGVWPKVAAAGFRPKGGAYYFWGDEEWEVRFPPGRDGSNAWQVVRSEFDKLLLDHAREAGVEVHEGVAVKQVGFAADGRPTDATWVSDSGESGRISCDFLLDASGRAGLMTTKYTRNRQLHDVFRNVAVWAYWKGARDLDRGPDGAITVASLPDGWFWGIPLHDGTLSVGLVTGKDAFAQKREEAGGIDAAYHAALDRTAPIKGLLGDTAEQVSDVKVEQDYSYAATSFTGPGYLLLGDAACFLDPLLSTGVHLATFSAMLAAASIGSVLRGELSEQDAWSFFEVVYRRAYQRLLVLVSTFYESYRGKDYHFYNAQRLSEKDWQGMDVQAAFDRFVTGIADLEDAGDAARAVLDHLHGVQSGSPNPLDNLNRSHEHKEAPYRPEKAVDGLYVTFEPTLGLRRVDG